MTAPIERLEATYGNGLAIQDIMLDDYQRIGVSQDDALRMVHGLQGDALPAMIQRMEEGRSKEYYGVREDSLLAGFAVLGNWHYGDERPFLTNIEYYTARLMHKRDQIYGEEPKSQYDGIHGFGVSSFVDEYETVAEPLLEHLRLRSAERGKVAIRAAIDVEDSRLLDIFEREGKPVTRKLGMISLGGVLRGYSLYEIETA